MTSPRIIPGTAHPALAGAIAAALGAEPVACEVERFPDGEARPVVGHVRGDDVYVVQPTSPAAGEHLTELMLLLDACRRAGARRITAVLPYAGYARQDRRTRAGQAVGARVALDAVVHAGAQRLVVVDPHTPALEAMSPAPMETLTAVPLLASRLAGSTPDNGVIVSPDLGGVKGAEHYAALLRRPVAVVRKTRVSGATVRAAELAGNVDGRPVVITDDMISTGGTIEAAVRVVLAHGAAPDITVAATHGLLVGAAPDRIGRLPVRRLVITDTVPPVTTGALPVQVVSVAPLLAEAVRLLHDDEPLDPLRMRA